MTEDAAGRMRWLCAEDCNDEGTVGGKAASLSRLAARYPVPPGFALPALPASMVLTPALSEAIERSYLELGDRCGVAEPVVAVRSSAVDEDGVGSSFAGQHATYLNVRGGAAVVDAVQRCMRSAESTEATTYRQSRGLNLDDVRIAVLVQQLVNADVAAVAFSANPVSGERGEVMITSNWGLGESIVGGTVTPDLFVLQKESLALTMQEIGTKERMTVRTDLGTDDVDTPAELQHVPSLSEAEVREIATLAVSLEAEVGSPVDIECAIAGGVLYLLQCRPITTLR